MRARILLPVLVAAPLVAVLCRAAPEIPVRVAVVGACTDAPGFTRALLARTPRLRSAAPGEVGRAVQVQIEARGARWVGAVSLDYAPPRTLEAASCDDLVSALSFVAAIALDPAAIGANPPASASSASASSVAATMPAASSTPPSPSAPSAPPRPPVASVASTAPSDAPVPLDPADAMWTLARADRAFVLQRATRSTTAFEVSESVELAHGGAIGGVLSDRIGAGLLSTAPATLSPGVWLSVGRSLTATATSTSGAATLQWTTIAIDGCPLRVALGRGVVMRPCLGLLGGGLHAEGRSVAHPAEADEAWLAARATVRAEVLLLGWLVLGGHVGAELPFFRDQFAFDSEGVQIYRAPWALPFAGLWLAVRIP